MARQKEQIMYVHYYAPGSAARKVELPAQAEAKRNPREKKARPSFIHLDGLSVVGIVASAVMLVCMLSGFYQLGREKAELQEMQAYITDLYAQNQILQNQYENGYDLDTVRVAAESMGLVPRDQVQHITITLPEPEVVEEPTWWESFVEDISSMFA